MYNRIELIDKLIKIPANKEKLVMHEDNTDIFIVRIPRYLLTDDLTKSKVFILAENTNTEGHVIIKELEFFFDDEEYIEYLWKVTKEYTAIEGELIIQFKIIRDNSLGEENPPENPPVPIPGGDENPDGDDTPPTPTPGGDESSEEGTGKEDTSNEDVPPPFPGGTDISGGGTGGATPTSELLETNNENEEVNTEEKPKNLEDIDQEMNVSTNINQDSVWFSYQNRFKIVKVLNPLV